MNRECKAELLGEEDRAEAACGWTAAEVAVLKAARRYAAVVRNYPTARGVEVAAHRVGELLAARDELCAAAGEVE